MATIDYPRVIKELIDALKKMPGVGPRSAERIAVWMIQHKKANPVSLAEALLKAESQVDSCEMCGFFVDDNGCAICGSAARDSSLLCVVEQPTDVIPMEKAGVFNGFYHCLGGKLAPLDNVTPEDLNIQSLEKRVEALGEIEVILALSMDVEGEATANYLAEILTPYPCKVTRIAQGLPAGGGLENADQLTLMRALQGRR